MSVDVGELGVVVLSYGQGGELEGVLESLTDEGIPAEAVVLVHNPSRPNQPPPSTPAGMETIRAEANLGYAGGMNLGIERHLDRGVELVLLLTHDARLLPGAVSSLVGAARGAPEYGILGPALLLAGTREAFSLGGLTDANGSTRHRRVLDPPPHDGIAPCDWVDGGTMLIRADVVRQVGGFDERYWSYCEEAELCQRALELGHGVAVVVAAKAEQAPGGSQRIGAWAYLMTRNGISYGKRARGLRAAGFLIARAIWIAAFGTLRAALRGSRIRGGDPMIPWAQAVGARRGLEDFLRGRWGPPPPLPGPGDIANTAPRTAPEMAARPRVLHMGPATEIGGGMAAALRALLDSPLAQRYQLDVVATYRGAEPIGRLGVYGVSLLRLMAWRARRRGSIVHIHATVRGSMYRKSLLSLLASALGLRVVFQIHSGPGDVAAFAGRVGPSSIALFRRGLEAADVVVAVSQATADAVESGYGATGVGVVPNAAPRVSAPSRADPVAMKLLYLGGFANPAKGGDVLLAALAEGSLAPGTEVVIAGPGEPLEHEEHPLEGAAVSWRGWLGEGERLAALREVDSFVLPSRSEGLPMALLEAMSAGLAIVATSVGGVPDVLDDETDALLVPPEDSARLAEALGRLSADPDLRARLGRAARERATELDASVVAKRLDVIYSGLV